DPGANFAGDLLRESPVYRRFTNTGQLRVDASSHAFAFLPGTASSESAIGAARLRVSPNPTRNSVWVNLGDTESRQTAFYDANGRRTTPFVRIDPGGPTAMTPPGVGIHFLRVQETGQMIRVVRTR
ncbi:MAG: hypothetical protein IT349_03225, partial [Candidatus Eisenbacteria bacterium]|nr:hypothetical protein [Candidatus Eisenbacteria bacterium]